MKKFSLTNLLVEKLACQFFQIKLVANEPYRVTNKTCEIKTCPYNKLARL
jgi:hypothetical protein